MTREDVISLRFCPIDLTWKWLHFTVLLLQRKVHKIAQLNPFWPQELSSPEWSCYNSLQGEAFDFTKKLNCMEKSLKSLILIFFFPSWKLFRIMVYLSLVSQKIFRASQWQEWANTNRKLWAYLILITGLNKLPLLYSCVVKIHKTRLARLSYVSHSIHI